MDKILFYINLWLATAISASVVHFLSALSPIVSNAAAVLLLILALLWAGAFIADDWFVRKLKVSIEAFRFAMIALAAAVLVGLTVPQLPGLLALLGA